MHKPRFYADLSRFTQQLSKQINAPNLPLSRFIIVKYACPFGRLSRFICKPFCRWLVRQVWGAKPAWFLSRWTGAAPLWWRRRPAPRALEKAIAEFEPIRILGAFYKGETRLAREINLFIKRRYRFLEAALVRRSLVSLDMMRRERHGLNHFWTERKPNLEAAALIRLIKSAKSQTMWGWGRVLMDRD